jgi:predicted protein tyrosine phosphatase
MIVIPNNTTNCISKVAEHPDQYKQTCLFLGSIKSTRP